MIATRDDLDAVAGTEAHDAFMRLLSGSIWRLEKDHASRTWVAVFDDATIRRFGFSVDDFPGAVPPELPVYKCDVCVPASVSRFQLRAALWQMSLLESVDAYMTGAADMMARLAWSDSLEFSSGSEFTRSLSLFLDLSTDQMDDIFVFASSIRA